MFKTIESILNTDSKIDQQGFLGMEKCKTIMGKCKKIASLQENVRN